MTSKVEDVEARIAELCAEGNALADEEDFAGALSRFEQALALIPEPADDHESTQWVCVSIGDMHFQLGQYAEGREFMRRAVALPDGLGNPFIHLRLGQFAFELGDMARAGDELARAYMGGGEEIFDEDDPKYFQYVKSILRPARDS
ncbi:TPR repeat protein [Myxococcus hansupus]|uniref:TPR repeat protein n=1 Tax=Pseudomyxococcus hansupus TaxID=1297742 RepID=A0A0H4XA72_9BACT|nr:tetratricopeptide repeat protein [Myxococcus hansupus]AKQ64807.1 TPR repeat protein [Myxococcus hansupus]